MWKELNRPKQYGKIWNQARNGENAMQEDA